MCLNNDHRRVRFRQHGNPRHKPFVAKATKTIAITVLRGCAAFSIVGVLYQGFTARLAFANRMHTTQTMYVLMYLYKRILNFNLQCGLWLE